MYKATHSLFLNKNFTLKKSNLRHATLKYYNEFSISVFLSRISKTESYLDLEMSRLILRYVICNSVIKGSKYCINNKIVLMFCKLRCDLQILFYAIKIQEDLDQTE